MEDLVMIVPGIHIVHYPAMGVISVCSLVANLLCVVDGWRDDRI